MIPVPKSKSQRRHSGQPAEGSNVATPVTNAKPPPKRNVLLTYIEPDSVFISPSLSVGTQQQPVRRTESHEVEHGAKHWDVTHSRG